MEFLEVENLSKNYSKIKVLNNISFKIKKGEFVSIFGPNGCGKTTILNLISGLDKEYKGKIKFKNKDFKLGYVFQNPNDSILPWEKVIENISLGKKALDDKKIFEILKEVNLWKFRDKYPYQLSGGMKQLLAISRAFIYDCDFLILDEPFSSLDYYMVLKVRENLRKLYEQKKPTILFVSHNIDDAIMLSDKIILLSKQPGKIIGVINVVFPNSRNDSLILSKKFLEYKKKILGAIKNEVKE